ncbi:MAG: nucleotidyltransferase family protein [Clostridia bacterium]|nr:nucleotidyltransferase family protein [Clostridia bacterium]
MKTAAVVAEYNPFHSGHKYQLEKTRAAGATHVVAVMSGNFVQRGEAAIYDKYLRASAAVKCGADLVVELPLPWATGTAQTFARGAVGLAKAFGNVDMLSFGCENSDLPVLEKLADTLYSEEYENIISSLLSQNKTFASIRQSAVEALCGADIAKLLEKPNNILAVEYIAAAKNTGCNFEFNAVSRVGDGYNENIYSGNGFASATALRETIRNNCFDSSLVPEEVSGFYTDEFSDFSRLDLAVLSKLRTLSVEEIALAPDISEGLENRIYSAIREAVSVEDLLEKIKTKRYTAARIRRIVLSLFLGVKAQDSVGTPPYIRILACNEKGKEILNSARPELPVVGRASQLKELDGRAGEIFSLECKADDIYALSFAPARECGAYYKTKIF